MDDGGMDGLSMDGKCTESKVILMMDGWMMDGGGGEGYSFDANDDGGKGKAHSYDES